MAELSNLFQHILKKIKTCMLFEKPRLLLIQAAYSNAVVSNRKYSITSLTKIYLMPPKISGVNHCYFQSPIIDYIGFSLSSRNVTF
jgi:hypothetical protein